MNLAEESHRNYSDLLSDIPSYDLDQVIKILNSTNLRNIQILGVPASGKSFLIRTAYINKFPQTKPRIILFHRLYEALFSNYLVPRAFLVLLSPCIYIYLRLSKSCSFSMYFKYLHSIQGQSIRQRNYKIRLFCISWLREFLKYFCISPNYIDENTFYRSLSLAQSEFNPLEISRYLQYLPQPDLLVFLNPPYQTILDRLENRSSSSNHHFETLQNSYNCLCLIAKHFKTTPKICFEH